MSERSATMRRDQAGAAGQHRGTKIMFGLARWILIGLFTTAGLVGVVYVVTLLSPWPWVLLLRHSFAEGAKQTQPLIAKYAPHDVLSELNVVYDADDKAAKLDVFYPESVKAKQAALPMIVWIHGGGWIGGRKDDLADYMRILAHEGYTAVAIEYAHAPGKKYPTPLIETNQAFKFLMQNAVRYHIDPSRIILAGDSAGAQIAAQYANIVSVASYAELLKIEPSIQRSQLRGVVLYCGAYSPIDTRSKGLLGKAAHAMLWAYLGTADFNDPKIKGIDLPKYVDSNYPPAFISDGGMDALLPQSQKFISVLQMHSVPVEALLFPVNDGRTQHEYQYIFDTPEAKLSLETLLSYLRKRTAAEPVALQN